MATPVELETFASPSIPKKASVIILAGATGDLGHRIAQHLCCQGATVRALVRKGSSSPTLEKLVKLDVELVEVNYNSLADLTNACAGGTCVVSALSGLREVIVDMQTNLLTAAVAAGVNRFIPSDFCIDYTKLAYGTNRNLDLRREFNERLNQAHIKATSILNGMFTDLLTGQAPLILTGLKRILYWGSADQLLDFTTIEDTAAFTAAAALDPTTPRYLCVAGEVTSIRGLQKTVSDVAGKPYGLLRAGGLGLFKRMISVTRALAPQKGEVFPAWQGMQYLHNMFTGLPKLEPLANNRYPNMHWTSVREVIAQMKL